MILTDWNSASQEDYQESIDFNPMLWGTIGYLFLFIFRPFEFWEWLGVYRIERIYMILLLIGIVIWPGKRYIKHSINYTLLVFIFVMIFSMFFAYDINRAWEQIWEQIKLLVLFFVIILSIRNKVDFRILIIGFIAVTGIYVAKSMWEFFINGRHVYRMGISRLIGIDQTYSDPNTFAATIIYSLPFVWALWKSTASNKLKITLAAYGLMSISAIGLTGSRSGMLSFVFFLLLIWLRGRKKMIGVVSVIVIITLSWFFLPDIYKERFRTLYDDSINETATESADSRIQHFKWGIDLYLDRPVLGWGPRCSPIVVNRVLNQDHEIQLHNLTAQLLAELGTVGALAFIALLLRFYQTNRKIKIMFQYACESTNFLLNISTASIQTMWLLLFQGLAGHNLYRYTWYWIAAVFVLSDYFTRIEYEKKA